MGCIKSRNWTEEEKNTIIQLYIKQGLTCTEIARKYAAKPDTISKYLKLWNIPIKRNISKNRLLNEFYFNQIDSPTKAYFLGLLFADGSISISDNRSACIKIELIEKDKDILALLKKELNSDASFRYNKRKNRHATFSLCIRNNQLASDLFKFNIKPNKTYVVDQLIFPENYQIDFLRGLIDGDGSIYFSEKYWHINFCSHSKNIVKQVRDFGSKLINASCGKITEYDGVYRYTWNGKKAKQLMNILYNNDHAALARKRIKAIAAQEDNRVEDIV